MGFEKVPRLVVLLAGVAMGFALRGLVQHEPVSGEERAAPIARAANAQEAAFNALYPERQQFVVNTYQLALDLYKKQDYEKSLYELEKLHQIMPQGYRDSFDVKLYAQKAAAIVRASREEKTRQDRLAEVRRHLDELLGQARQAVEGANAVEAEVLFVKILEIDPENAEVPRLRERLKQTRARN